MYIGVGGVLYDCVVCVGVSGGWVCMCGRAFVYVCIVWVWVCVCVCSMPVVCAHVCGVCVYVVLVWCVV